MKKRFLGIFILFLILINLSIVYSLTAMEECVARHQNDCGVKICNANKDCGASDGICPNDYFTDGKTCYIIDPDCCTIKANSIRWSKDSQGTPLESTSVKEGDLVYMYVETENCNGKDAHFDTYGVIPRDILSFRFSDEERVIKIDFADPLPKVINNKVYASMRAYSPNADITKLKFKVRVNPTAESPLLDITLGEKETAIDSELCTQFWTNPELCASTLSACPQCTEYISSGSACNGFSCRTGECLNGLKSLECNIPKDCSVARPSGDQIKCYEKTVPFPFFSGFNVLIVVLLLSGYYGIIIYKK